MSSSSSSAYRRLHGLFTTSLSATTKQKTTTVSPVSSKKARTNERRLRKMVDDFKKSSESHRFRARHGVYHSMVRRLASAQKFSMIEDILEAQKKYSDITDEGFATRLIMLYGKANMFNHARSLFDELPDLNCQRTVKSFNGLLAACVNSKEFDKIDSIFRELPKEMSIEVNVISYNIVMNAFCETKSFDSAVSLFDELKENGMEPDLVTYNTLLGAFYKNGRFSDGENIWSLMESKNIDPNIISYNSRLRGMVVDKKMAEAVGLIDEMNSKGISPDVYSYNSMINGFSIDGNLEEAKRWYNELKQNECKPDRFTHTTLLPLLCEKGEFDLALELCTESINRRLLMVAAEVKRVINGLVKENKIEEATKLVELGNSNKFFDYKLELPLLMTT